MKFDIGSCPAFAFITVISLFRQLIDRWSQCSGSAEPSVQVAHVLAGRLLKFLDHVICCNAPTLNNSQNLNLDFLEVSFLSSMNSGTWEYRRMPNFRGNEDLDKLGK